MNSSRTSHLSHETHMISEVRADITTAAEPFWSSFQSDLRRIWVYEENSNFAFKFSIVVKGQGIWALAAYRFARRLKSRPVPLLQPILMGLYRTVERVLNAATGISLHPDSRIAPGFFIGHFGAITVGPGVVIGANSSIGQMCAVLPAGPEGKCGAPVIGERVYLGVGCKVIGGVHVGNGVAVGANAVVLEDVPENGVAVGNPATVANFRGSGDFIRVPPPRDA